MTGREKPPNPPLPIRKNDQLQNSLKHSHHRESLSFSQLPYHASVSRPSDHTSMTPIKGRRKKKYNKSYHCYVIRSKVQQPAGSLED